MKASKTCRKLLNDYGGATRVEMFWIYKDVATVVCEHQVRQKKVFATHMKWEEVISARASSLLRWNFKKNYSFYSNKWTHIFLSF